MLLGGEDVSTEIRTPAMSLGASKVSGRPVVRAGLLELQRRLALAVGNAGAVLEGRDIGTVVFPDADAKFFLTASPEERARRRHAELSAKGDPSTFDEVLADQLRRDRDDSERAVAPLRPAADAVVVDTSGVPLDEVVDGLVREVQTRLAARAARAGAPRVGGGGTDGHGPRARLRCEGVRELPPLAPDPGGRPWSHRPVPAEGPDRRLPGDGARLRAAPLPRRGRPERAPAEPARRRAARPAAPVVHRAGAAAPGPVIPQSPLPEELTDMTRDEFAQAIREALQEETAEVRLAPKWEGGTVVLKPGDGQTAPKEIPLDALLHKVVMIRDRLRVLEQRINAHEKLSDAEKVDMQQYVTRCYGSLTTFNVLFREERDRFVGREDLASSGRSARPCGVRASFDAHPVPA